MVNGACRRSGAVLALLPLACAFSVANGGRVDAFAADEQPAGGAHAPLIDTQLSSRMEALLFALPSCDPPSDATARHEFRAVDVSNYDDETRVVVVGIMLCSRAAYNTTNVVMIADGDAVELAALPRITVDPVYASPKDDAVLRDLRIAGMGASIYATDARFDPTTATLTSTHRLRGLGDASVFTSWQLGRDGFVLETHDVDLTYNEQQDSMRVVEKGRIIEPRPLGPNE